MLVYRLLSLLAFWIKSLFLAPTTHLSKYWPMVLLSGMSLDWVTITTNFVQDPPPRNMSVKAESCHVPKGVCRSTIIFTCKYSKVKLIKKTKVSCCFLEG